MTHNSTPISVYQDQRITSSGFQESSSTHRRPAHIDDKRRFPLRFSSGSEIRQEACTSHRVGRARRERLDRILFGLCARHESSVVGGEKERAREVKSMSRGLKPGHSLRCESEKSRIEDRRVFSFQ